MNGLKNKNPKVSINNFWCFKFIFYYIIQIKF